MQQQVSSKLESARRSAFEIYLRTGRRPTLGPAVELKFNPWHDPDDGRFTFAGTGRYFPGGRSSASGNRASDDLTPNYERFSPRHPRNHSIYAVRVGDNLTRIAALRKGLRASDLAWLNRIPPSSKLQIGQKLILPTQAHLEEGRRARAKFLDLAFYMETHDGRLPPDLTNIPSIDEQLNSDWRRTSKNGYEFQRDVIERTRRVKGELTLESTERRSRRLQVHAGGADRRQSDDGGHYIAARFNGPREAFNHFAQDSSFNRGTYRALEDSWAKDVRAGRRVFVDIIPRYVGASARPASLTVLWYVDGKRFRKRFPNERKGK